MRRGSVAEINTHKSEPLRSMAISQTSSSCLLRCEVFHGRSPEVSACPARAEQTPTDCSFHGRAALMHCYTHVHHANPSDQVKLPSSSCQTRRSDIIKTLRRNQVGTNASTANRTPLAPNMITKCDRHLNLHINLSSWSMWYTRGVEQTQWEQLLNHRFLLSPADLVQLEGFAFRLCWRFDGEAHLLATASGLVRASK